MAQVDHQEELLPCPWCDSEAAITDVRMSGYSFRPHCTRRGCLLWEQGVYFASAEEAAKVWNTRSAALPVEGELRPCPCGSRAQVALTEELFHVECDDQTCCLALGTVVKYPYREAAIHAWDRLACSAPVVPQPAGRLWGELLLDDKGEAHFICHTKDDDFGATKEALQKFIALLQRQISNEKECPFYAVVPQPAAEKFHEAARELAKYIDVYFRLNKDWEDQVAAIIAKHCEPAAAVPQLEEENES